ncbi:acyl carrier protein, mitochondrial [Trichomonascus vanleenenianus]|uniref:acyl carrier protein, mitochondrial n=1 Tax=Trichomonascus vanleenenianus TaxID=2268995 RepID=UPI003ECB04A2
MLARSIIRSARLARPVLARSISLAVRPAVVRKQQTLKSNWGQVRFYGGLPPPLTREFVEERIVDLLKCFDKITEPEKITPAANFVADLGLDSLDVVECLFFIEEEFGIEMPEDEANEIKTVGQAIDYILAQPDAF